MSSVPEKITTDTNLQTVLQEAIDYARAHGADSVEIAAHNDKGFSVSARLGDVETVEHHNQRSLGVTVYR